MAIGGHHSVVVIGVPQPAPTNDFAGRVRALIKGGGMQDCSHITKVFAWGWGDKGQLGRCQKMEEQGLECTEPLHFIDRRFEDGVDEETGNMTPQLCTMSFRVQASFGKYVMVCARQVVLLCVLLLGHLVPRLIHEIDYSHQIVSVAAGLDHSVALTSGGMIFTWGDNSEGQCGLGHRIVTVRSPTLNPTIRNHRLVVLRSEETDASVKLPCSKLYGPYNIVGQRCDNTGVYNC